ncbi:MAG: hypothetical protein H6727_04080 [Myxococcales bacterium]|nr:hypothetical protein [Myxococcales bacterium]
MRVLKWLGMVILFLLLLVGIWAFQNRQNLRNLAELNSAWYAQNTCSCIFVTQRSEKDCMHYVRQVLPYSKLNIDRKNKSVTATATATMLWNTSTSRYLGPRHGCTLENK